MGTAAKPRILGIVGATASGKSALALEIAGRLNGEIVCMDAMQVYRGMDIGTAKPTREERQRVPHHMLDVADPKDGYSVARYKGDAAEMILGILSRGKTPVLCGGTGLYLRALSLPLDFGHTPADETLRESFRRIAETEGAQALHDMLAAADPRTAGRLHPNDLRRVIRALEVVHLTGNPLSDQQMPGPDEGEWDMRLISLDWPREELYARIDRRVDAMMAAGLLSEIRGLMDAGLTSSMQSIQGLGYKELTAVISGETTLPDAVELLKRRTRNYAKRQLTWFRADSRILWLQGSDGTDSLTRQALKYFGEDA